MTLGKPLDISTLVSSSVKGKADQFLSSFPVLKPCGMERICSYFFLPQSHYLVKATIMSTDKRTPFLMDHPCLQSCVSPTSLKSIFLGNSLLLNQLKALRKMSDVFNVDPRPHIGPGRSHMACFPFGLPH